MALDTERVGLHVIEVPQVCDFGDNVLDYMTRGGHTTEPEPEEDISDEVSDSDSGEEDVDVDVDDDDTMSRCSAQSEKPEPIEHNVYGGVLPKKFIAFLKS
jgi:hypothetical protein